VTSVIVPSLLADSLWQGSISYLTHDIRAVLLADTYVPDQDLHQFADDLDLGTNEFAGSGYSAGGESLTTKTIDSEPVGNHVWIKSDPVMWASLDGDVRYGALIDVDSGVATTEPILCVIDFGGVVTLSSQEFRLIPNVTTGWLDSVAALA